MTTFRIFLGGLVAAGALAAACSDSGNYTESPGGTGGESSSTGGKNGMGGEEGGTGGSAPVIGDKCSDASDCENDDADHCSVTCEDVEGEKRCLTIAVDADDDGHGTTECAVAPGDDCNDSDDRDSPSGDALVAQGAANCATVCTSAQSIAWTKDGEALLAYANGVLNDSGADGAREVIAQRLDENGEPTGDTTTWGYQRPSTGALSSLLHVTRKGDTENFGIVFAGYIQNTDAYNASFMEGTLGLGEQLSQTTLSLDTQLLDSHWYDLEWADTAWNTYGVYNYMSSYGYVGDGSGLPAEIDIPSHSSVSAITGNTRGLLALSESSNGNQDYDPALVLYRFAATGDKLNEVVGSPTVLIGNGREDDIKPTTALGSIDGQFAAFYREDAADIPLTATLIGENGAKVGSEKTYSSDIIPMQVIAAESGGGTLLGWRQNGSVYEVVAQRFDSELEFVGDVLLLETISDAPTRIRATGSAQDQAAVYTTHTRSNTDPDNGYRLFYVNACR